MTQQMEVDISRVDSADVIAVRGELDMASALSLAAPLTDLANDGERAVLLDLSRLTFMDSTGMSVLLNARRRLTRQGRDMVVVCPSGAVRRVLEMTSMLETL